MPDSVEEVSRLREVAVLSTQRALNFARRELRRQVTSNFVNPEATRGNPEQQGFPPTKIDAMMDHLVRQMVLSAVPDCVYLSEEGLSTVYPDPGDIFAWCDPLDGTTNAFTIFSGYAVVLFSKSGPAPGSSTSPARLPRPTAQW
jgi:fructose-1,6-bisphosphatase/inositol monophosphatase family enzyme